MLGRARACRLARSSSRIPPRCWCMRRPSMRRAGRRQKTGGGTCCEMWSVVCAWEDYTKSDAAWSKSFNARLGSHGVTPMDATLIKQEKQDGEQGERDTCKTYCQLPCTHALSPGTYMTADIVVGKVVIIGIITNCTIIGIIG